MDRINIQILVERCKRSVEEMQVAMNESRRLREVARRQTMYAVEASAQVNEVAHLLDTTSAIERMMR